MQKMHSPGCDLWFWNKLWRYTRNFLLAALLLKLIKKFCLNDFEARFCKVLLVFWKIIMIIRFEMRVTARGSCARLVAYNHLLIFQSAARRNGQQQQNSLISGISCLFWIFAGIVVLNVFNAILRQNAAKKYWYLEKSYISQGFRAHHSVWLS